VKVTPISMLSKADKDRDLSIVLKEAIREGPSTREILKTKTGSSTKERMSRHVGASCRG
jgi:hypothetical protein